MRRWTVLPWLVLVPSVFACSAETELHEEPIGARADELVGGHPATESEYPATVYLGGCTGVKVGPRHFLSAAHCFGDPNMATLAMTPNNDASNITNLTVVSVNVHPEYTNCSQCANDGSMSDFGFRPDVALIVVAEDTPSVPEATIDPEPVTIADAVTLSGYGCENGVGQPSGPPRLKVGDTDAIDPFLLSDAASIPDAYVTTYGPEVDADSPGLCPGDSGAPLYRTGTDLVVGVAALVSFNGQTGNPVGNWHTRVDSESRYDIFGWANDIIQGGGTPCSSLCGSPVTSTSQYFSQSYLGTGASCYEVVASPTAANCGGFASNRTLSINGTNVSCNSQSFTLPAKRNGGYCFVVGAGQNPWAWINAW